MNENAGAFLRSARERLGYRQVDVATACGINTTQGVSLWEKGQLPIPPRHVEAVAALLQFDPILFIERFYRGSPQYEILRDKLTYQRRTNNLSAVQNSGETAPVFMVGTGWYKMEEPLMSVQLPDTLARQLGHTAKIFMVEGDSMSPEFNDGDMVVPDQSLTFKDGEACVCCRCNDGVEYIALRRCYRCEHAVRLVPDNRAYREELLTDVSCWPVISVTKTYRDRPIK